MTALIPEPLTATAVLLPSALPVPSVIRCGISPHFWNKENRAPYRRLCAKHTSAARRSDPKAADVYDGCWAFSRCATTELLPEQLTGHILNGYAWIPSTFGGNGRRVNTNWLQAELIAIDYDDNVRVADCLRVPFIRQYALLVHPTSSSSAACYKTRVIFRLEVAITGNLENYPLTTFALCRMLNLPEDACSTKPSQLFYGSTNRIETPHINLDAVLPQALIEPLVTQLRAERLECARLQVATRAARDYRPVERNSQRAQSAVDWAVDDAYNKVASAVSDRTRAAYGQAYRLGRYVPYWLLNESRIETELLNASGANKSLDKYGERELLRHIQNGLNAGKLSPEPLELPAPRRVASNGRAVQSQRAPHPPVATARPTVAQQSDYYHAEGLPRSWLLAICQAFPGSGSVPKFARLLFEAARQRLIEPEDFTLKQLFKARTALKIPIKDGAIRSALKATERLFWNLNSYDTTGSNSKITSGGRPEGHFCVRMLSEIEEGLQRWTEKRFEEARHRARDTTPTLSAMMIDALDGDARVAASEIVGVQPPASEDARRAARRAQKDNEGQVQALTDLTPTTISLEAADVRVALMAEGIPTDQPYSSSAIAIDYGLSKASVAKKMKQAGFAAVIQTVSCPITSPETLEYDVSAACKRQGGFPCALRELPPEGEPIEHLYQTADLQGNGVVVAAAQARGNRIEVVLRTANKYRHSEPAEVSIAKPAAKPSAQVRFRRRSRARKPSEIHPYYGPGYNPTVVRLWLKTLLRTMGWREQAGRFTNPATGEIFDLREPDLFTDAEALGAVVTVLA